MVLLYGGIAYAGIRIARRMTDTFMRLAAAAVTGWIVIQALINIGAVVGLLPITGIPLPLVSEGLSSLLVTMAGLGMLLSFARHEPGADAGTCGGWTRRAPAHPKLARSRRAPQLSGDRGRPCPAERRFG